MFLYITFYFTVNANRKAPTGNCHYIVLYFIVLYCIVSNRVTKFQLNVVWYRVREADSQLHTTTQKYTPSSLLLGLNCSRNQKQNYSNYAMLRKNTSDVHSMKSKGQKNLCPWTIYMVNITSFSFRYWA